MAIRDRRPNSSERATLLCSKQEIVNCAINDLSSRSSTAVVVCCSGILRFTGGEENDNDDDDDDDYLLR